jgi:hypothetical protein
MLFETRLKIHISRCENRPCVYYLNPVDEEICNSCPRRLSIEGEDELANSMMDDVYGIEVDERSDETVDLLFTTHCKKCTHYNKTDAMCRESSCDYAIPIKVLMRRPETHCPLELW